MPTSTEALLEPYLAGGYKRENGDLDLHCPIHGDKRRSATINFKTGEWYCNSCEDGGSISGLLARQDEWHPPPLIPGGTTTKQGRNLPLPDSARLDGWQSALIGNESALEWLEAKRGISLETVQRYGLGWDGRRWTMPVYDEAGVLRNVRCYSNTLEPKILNWPGHGSPPRLYPMAVLLNDPKVVVLCEGEFDALLANQQGIPAVTGTSGVKNIGKWRDNWSEWFKDKSVYVCFDQDHDGDINARRVIKKLERYAKRIKQIQLPFPMGSGKDMTDYLLEGGSFSALRKLGKPVKATKRAAPVYRKISYEGLREGAIAGKAVWFEATLSGVYSSQIFLPTKLKADCNMDWDPKRCAVCPMSAMNGKMTNVVENDHDLHLDLLGISSSEARDRRYRKVMNIPQHCSQVEIAADVKVAWDSEARNGSNLSEQAVPMLILQDGPVPEVNRPYKWFGVAVPNPHGQRSIFIARRSESAKQDLDNFEPNPDMAAAAKEWVLSFGSKPEEQMDAISERFENRVTRIYGQRLLHIAIDLIYHSVLNFKLGDKMVGRGWMEALAIGETRSGKSTTAQALQEIYGYGHYKSGENVSVAGLLQGIEKRPGLSKDGNWAASVGELPLCDRRLLILDEAQGLDKSDISKMSDVRSRGVAEIQKIRASKVDARVRIIWLGNGRKNEYKFGIDALMDQMGQKEDLARVDIPMYISHDIGDELKKTRLHSQNLPDDELEIISWMVLWAWSRRPDQVIWSERAQEAVYDMAESLAEEYSTTDMPILPKNESHIRLARMTVALAARLFASPDGHKLSIRGEHVMGAYELYRMFLQDPRLGIVDLKEEEVATETSSQTHAKDVRELLMMSSQELVHKMSAGHFSGLVLGAYSENTVAMDQLLAWHAIALDGPGFRTQKWAKEIAIEIEKERHLK